MNDTHTHSVYVIVSLSSVSKQSITLTRFHVIVHRAANRVFDVKPTKVIDHSERRKTAPRNNSNRTHYNSDNSVDKADDCCFYPKHIFCSYLVSPNCAVLSQLIPKNDSSVFIWPFASFPLSVSRFLSISLAILYRQLLDERFFLSIQFNYLFMESVLFTGLINLMNLSTQKNDWLSMQWQSSFDVPHSFALSITFTLQIFSHHIDECLLFCSWNDHGIIHRQMIYVKQGIKKRISIFSVSERIAQHSEWVIGIQISIQTKQNNI